MMVGPRVGAAGVAAVERRSEPDSLDGAVDRMIKTPRARRDALYSVPKETRETRDSLKSDELSWMRQV